MPSPFFGLNIQSANPTVRRYLGLASTAVGVTFGTAEGERPTSQPLNRVIQFGGQNTFLALLNNNVYRSANAGASWTSVYSYVGASGATSGLNVVYINGIPTVCFIWNNGSLNFVSGSYSTDGVNWTANNGIAVGAGTGPAFQKDTIFRNTLYTLPTGNTKSMIIYTPGSDVAKLDVPGGIFAYADSSSLCVFNDQLQLTNINTSGSSNKYLYSLTGGVWTTRPTLSTGTSLQASKTGMFVDSNSGELIVFNRKDTSDAWGCWRVDSNFTPIDISATVLPEGMLAAAGANARVLTFVDGSLDPGTNPDKYIIYANADSTGTPLSLYRWEGIATRMSDLDSGGSIRDALTLSNDCQGVGNWSNGQNSISLINRSPVSGGVRLFFKLYSANGTTNVSVRAWFGSQFHEYPLTQATITNPSNGTVVGNVNSGTPGQDPPATDHVIADNGATTYYFTWNNTADGIPVGDRFRLVLEVFV